MARKVTVSTQNTFVELVGILLKLWRGESLQKESKEDDEEELRPMIKPEEPTTNTKQES